MAIAEWSSVSVLIFLGLATLSTGEHAFIQDKLPASRRLPSSLCHLRCAKDSNKAISTKDCIRSCQGKLTLSSEQSHDSKKRMINKPLIRRQRSVQHDNNVVDECGNSTPQAPDPLKAENLLVRLAENGSIQVAWEAIDSSKTTLSFHCNACMLIRYAFNWTSYALIYHGGSGQLANCRVVPKNQTDYLVKQVSGWKLSNPINIAVVTHPYGGGQIKLQSFYLGGTPPTIHFPTVPTKDIGKFISSIVGGLIAGVTLLVILYAAVKWKRRTSLCPVTIDGQRMPPPLPSRPENSKERYYSCYYPESEEFRERVASIVNYFRENGYNVIMDRMVSEEITSQGPTRWGENQIRKAKKVLIFLSPGLVNLAMDSREDSQCQDINRVWIELEVLRDLYTRNRSAAKMVCIALPDIPVTSEALPLWAKVSYKWPDDALEILKRLNDRPMILPV